MDREEELMRAYTKAKKGSKDYYEDFCTMLFDEVYRLVALVYDKESNRKKIVNHIFNKMRTRLDEFNPNMDDIHRWVSVFTSSMIYSVYSMSNGDIFTYKDSNSGFEATHIEDDDAFAQCAVYYNDLITRNGFDKLNSVFVTLTKGQIILYELFCYAGCTVDEIEDLLEVDSVYVSSELCSIKNILMEDYAALGIEAESSQQDESYDEADSYADGDNADDSDYSDDGYEYEDDEYEDDYETANGGGLLDRVPEKALKLAVMCIIALILVIVLVLILVIGGNDKDDKGSDSKETSSQQKETIWATIDFNGGSDNTIPTGGANSSVSETDSEGNSESNSTADSQPTTVAPETKPNRPTTPTQTSGDNAGGDSGEGSGGASGDNAGGDLGEGSGDASGDNAGGDSGEGSGDASGDNTGGDSEEGSGDASGDNAGGDSGEGSGDASGDNAGGDSGEGSGDASGDNAGGDSGEGSGEGSGDSSELPADGNSEAVSENPA